MAIEWILIGLIGFGTGICGVLIGAGGGFILSPILLLYFGMPAETVVGTVYALLAVNSLSGGFTFLRMKVVDVRSAILFGIAALPGSIGAPFILKEVIKDSPSIFYILFGLILLGLAVRLLTQRDLPEDTQNSDGNSIEKAHKKWTYYLSANQAGKIMITGNASRSIISGTGQVFRYNFNEYMTIGFNFLLGFVSSFFGIGGGFLRTPILVYGFRFPVQIAVATSICAMMIYATAGASVYALLGDVEWFPTWVAGGIGLILGGQIGARLTEKIKGPWIMRVLTAIVFILGIQLIFLEGFGINLSSLGM